MPLLSRVKEFWRGREGASRGVAPASRTAVAGLLLHLARADGELAIAERRRLLDELGRRFGLDGAAAERLLAEGDRTDQEAGAVADLIEQIDFETWSTTDRQRLLAAAYAVAAADGDLHEFESDWAWRLGQLLGLDEGTIAAARESAQDG